MPRIDTLLKLWNEGPVWFFQEPWKMYFTAIIELIPTTINATQFGKGKDILIYHPQMALAGGLGIGKVGDLDTTCRR